MRFVILFMTFLVAEGLPAQDVQLSAITKEMYISIGEATQEVTLADNQATKALIDILSQSPITVTLSSSGGFEIWGALGFALPTSNEHMTAQPGDIVLYNGSNICIFYGTNSWSYTRLGKIKGLSENELRTFLSAGNSNIRVTLSLDGQTAINGLPSDAETDVYYNLSGQRLKRSPLSSSSGKNASKGIYIRNGKIIFL